MTKSRIPRGLVVVAIGIVLLVIGSSIFDNSYNVVESVMIDKQYLIDGKTVLQGESLNSTIAWRKLAEHSILVVDATPISSLVKLQVTEHGGGAFEKKSKNGYVYHIIGKNTQNQGNYSFSVSNEGTEPASIVVILGEDPYLSGKCSSTNQTSCYAIPTAIGIVIAGMLTLIIGSLVAINDFRKKKKPTTTY